MSDSIARRSARSRGRNTSPAPYWPRLGQLDAERARHLAQEAVRHLDQDAGAVAGVRLAAARAAVQQVDQQLQPLLDDRVRAPALHVDDEADAAGVVLVPRIVEALRARRLCACSRHDRAPECRLARRPIRAEVPAVSLRELRCCST